MISDHASAPGSLTGGGLPVIDATRAVDLLDKAVAERGASFRYDQSLTGGACVYVYDGKPACMVGLALSIGGGYPLNPAVIVDNNEAGVLAELPWCDAPAAAVFAAAQGAQDEGVTWMDALGIARETATAFGVLS